MRVRTGVLLLGLGGCGGGGAAVEAGFAPGGSMDGVSVAESGRSEAADSAGFVLSDLTPGPARIRLLRGGDTVGILQFAALPAGTRLRMHGLAVDPASGLAFPRSVDLDGAETVTLNGIRIAPEGRIPARPELDAAVLGWSPETGALLLRPADRRLPDLRVLVQPETDVVGTDGGGADRRSIAVGDSVRLEGRREGGVVIAERLVVRTRIAERAEPAAIPAATGERADGGAGDDEAPRVAAPPAAAPRPASSPAAAAPSPAADNRGEERGRGRGRGKAKGRDRG